MAHVSQCPGVLALQMPCAFGLFIASTHVEVSKLNCWQPIQGPLGASIPLCLKQGQYALQG
jgi:hypothetical protein